MQASTFVVALLLLGGCRDARPAPAPAPTPAVTEPPPPATGATGGSRGGDGSAAPSVTNAPITIDIIGPTATTTFVRSQLEALPAATAPIGDTVTKGQSLRDLVTAAGLLPTTIAGAKLWLVDGEGASLGLAVDDVVAGRMFAFLRINRHGELRLKTYEQVDAVWHLRGDLRGLRSIKLLAPS